MYDVSNSRRKFLKNTTMAAGTLPLMGSIHPIWSANPSSAPLSIHIFSKHLHFLDYKKVGEKSAEIGFDGVDLTVRPKGHVLPEFVKRDLPIAIEEIKKGGSQCIMMTTAIETVNNSLDVEVLETASKLGIKYYRMNWYKYTDEGELKNELLNYQQKITDLSILNKKLGIVGCYQNHAGTYVGASLWEVSKLLEFADPSSFGVQYDIRHAVAEGGLSWSNGLKLIKDSIKIIVLKDFKWSLINGVWKIENTPIGQGMVDFDGYFKLLKKYNINVPVSLHIEYEVGDESTSEAEKEELLYKTMRSDLKAIQQLWEKA